MGIYTDDDNRSGQMEILNVADHCFYCSEALTLPAVYWFGSTAGGSDYIWFHPKCAKKFSEQILIDYKTI